MGKEDKSVVRGGLDKDGQTVWKCRRGRKQQQKETRENRDMVETKEEASRRTTEGYPFLIRTHPRLSPVRAVNFPPHRKHAVKACRLGCAQTSRFTLHLPHQPVVHASALSTLSVVRSIAPSTPRYSGYRSTVTRPCHPIPSMRIG